MNNFIVKKINNNKHNLYTNNINDFKQAKEQLEVANTKFYSFTPKEEKEKSFLLKGLDNNENVNEIFNEVTKHNNDNLKFVKVSRFTTLKSKKENKILPIYLVQLSANSQTNLLHKIKCLNHQTIWWEKLKKRDSIQCKKCQRFGHTASNCKLDYRCVKCEKNHQPGECEIPPITEVDDKSKLYCVTCQKYGHPASYRGCPISK